MKIIKKQLELPEGTFEAEVQEFDLSDEKKMFHFFNSWKKLTGLNRDYSGRGVNIPEGLTETLYCLATNSYRTNNLNLPNVNTTMDCYNDEKKRIQVKACSTEDDVTSFGPTSEWDSLVFMDFFHSGSLNGIFAIYEIPDINSVIVKKSTGETLKERKLTGKRPRFSIKKQFIKPKRFLSKSVYKLTENGLIRLEEK